MSEFALDREVYHVGEEGVARVRWDPGERGLPRTVYASVGWRTEGRGTPKQDLITLARLMPRPPGQPVEFELPFAIPLEGPVSYTGELIRIIWEVELKLDIPMGRDHVERHPFQVLPRRLT